MRVHEQNSDSILDDIVTALSYQIYEKGLTERVCVSLNHLKYLGIGTYDYLRII